ncbi:MAG: RNA-binding domain-containing protein [Thermoplasmatota archaeon]
MILNGSAPVFPTEDPEKVLLCILNIFPDSEVSTSENEISFSSTDASKFMELLREQQIRDTAVMIIERGTSGDSASFNLNKQAAFVGKVNFTDGSSPLGDLEIDVIEGVEELVESIRPRLD